MAWSRSGNTLISGDHNGVIKYSQASDIQRFRPLVFLWYVQIRLWEREPKAQNGQGARTGGVSKGFTWDFFVTGLFFSIVRY